MNLEFQNVENILRQHSLDSKVSQFHGMLTGLICAGFEENESDDWLPVLVGDRFLTEAEYQPLKQDALELFRAVGDELIGEGFDFTVILPDEDHEFELRVRSLISWCDGFLEVLFLHGELSFNDLPEDCTDFVEDVQLISQIELDDEDLEDELDMEFFTLEHHLSIGVQLLFETINFKEEPPNYWPN